MSQILPELVSELGEGTDKLQLRIGLNSGPVTAGVLRGDKARFQLFGDTVNTASRMESNGASGRIHVSEATARLLKENGYERWVQKRSDLVEAKGKGSMQTYWVSRSVMSQGTERTMSSFNDDNSGQDDGEREEDRGQVILSSLASPPQETPDTFSVVVPPGKLGIAVEFEHDFPVIAKVGLDSPLRGKAIVNDAIIEINGVSTLGLGYNAVQEMLSVQKELSKTFTLKRS